MNLVHSVALFLKFRNVTLSPKLKHCAINTSTGVRGSLQLYWLYVPHALA